MIDISLKDLKIKQNLVDNDNQIKEENNEHSAGNSDDEFPEETAGEKTGEKKKKKRKNKKKKRTLETGKQQTNPPTIPISKIYNYYPAGEEVKYKEEKETFNELDETLLTDLRRAAQVHRGITFII